MSERHFHTLEILALGYIGAVLGFNASRLISAKLVKNSNPVVAKIGRGWLAANTFGSNA